MVRLKRPMAAAVVSTVVASILAVAAVAQAAPTPVNPGSMAGWETFSEGASAFGTFVAGPATPPIGNGSYRQVAKQGDKHTLRTNNFNGVALAGLDITYSTYSTTSTGSSVLTAAINMSVDSTGDGLSDATLVFEPYEQASIGAGPLTQSGVWQTWDAGGTGKWWSNETGYGINGPRFTLATYLSSHPGATIATLSQGAFRLVVGSTGTSWPNFNGNIDNVTVGSTTYDFEPSSVKVTAGNLNGWTTSVTGSGPNTSINFVNGPATPPLGLGSLRQRIGAADNFATLATRAYAGTPLAGLDLGYSTYVAASTPRAPALKIRVDRTGDGIGDETLKFEPAYQSPVTQANTWQTWDADQGNWWITGGGPPTFTLASYIASNPSAQIAYDPNSILIESGSSGGSWVGFDGNVDNVTINGTIYDFESLTELVDCDAGSNDIAAVQSAVDSAPDGGIIKLKGTCDFTGAPAHGGDTSSIVNTAVLIRPAAPVNGLTITSDGASQSATVLGSGTQAAFTIAPGNDNVTIKGLTFTNLGRAVVSINNDGTTIGALDGNAVPGALGNRIIGGSTMDSAVLGLAVDRNPSLSGPSGVVTIKYGAGAAYTENFTGQGTAKLTNYQVLGNYITYDPPGAENGTTRIAAIDVVQRYQNPVEQVRIKSNATGMFSSQFPTTNMYGIVMHSFNSIAPVGPVDPSDYLIRDVEIDGNNLGRLEELGPAADANAAGRMGIHLVGVSSFLVTDNGVRVVLSPTAIPMPGGGITVSDSGFGRIGPGNSVVVVADPSTEGSDLGAYGIVDDFGLAFAGNPKAQVTTDIEVGGNYIGLDQTGPVLAQRGFVVTKASNITVHQNHFWNTSAYSLNIGASVQGPGSVTSPGPITLPRGVTGGSLICQNDLELGYDAASDTNASAANVTSSAFPGGLTVGTTNSGCEPTIAVSKSLVSSTDTQVVSGKGWPLRDVFVVINKTGGGPTIDKYLTAGSDGSYSVAIPPSEMAVMPNGSLNAFALVYQPGGTPEFASTNSNPAVFTKDFVLPATPTISTPAEGSTVPASVTISGFADPGASVEIRQTAPTSAVLGTVTVNAGGGWSKAVTLASGAYTVEAVATKNGNPSAPSAARHFTVDASVPAAPTILVPSQNEVVLSSTVTISGTAEASRTIKVREGAVLLGQTTSDGSGSWSIAATMSDGVHNVIATATNGVGTTGPASAVRTFQVKTDFDAPLPPVIETPEGGSSQPQFVLVSGTAEIGSKVKVFEGAQPALTSTQTDATGHWQATLSFSTGSHTIRATATDAGGNESGDSAPVTFTVDGKRPGVTITTPNLTPFILIQPVQINGTASDDVGVASVTTKYYDIRGQLVATAEATLASPGGQVTTWQATPTGLSLGYYTVWASAKDAAGNVSATATSTFLKLG